jgi:hypothetical protein
MFKNFFFKQMQFQQQGNITTELLKQKVSKQNEKLQIPVRM